MATLQCPALALGMLSSRLSINTVSHIIVSASGGGGEGCKHWLEYINCIKFFFNLTDMY